MLGEARTRMSEATEQVQEQARIVLDEGKTKFNEAIETGKERLAHVKEELTGHAEEEANGDAPAA
jgi:Sec-independent protein translocase protein TatA